MLEKFLNIFRIPDLRKRVLFTLFILAVYRLGAHVPTPGVNTKLLEQFFAQNSSSSLGLIDMFSGGNLRRLTVFALGIMPYITAAIIFELLTVVYEPLARLQKEGDMGRKKITQWTRYMTVFLAVVQSFAIALTLVHGSGSVPYVTNPGPGLCVDDDADADRRGDVRDVAGRADYGSRHWQRNEPADLCRHCRGHPRTVLGTWFRRCRIRPGAGSRFLQCCCCWRSCWRWWHSSYLWNAASGEFLSSTRRGLSDAG